MIHSPIGNVLSNDWLRRGVAAYVVVAACAQRADGAGGRPRARCLLLGGETASLDPALDAAWLAGAGEP